MKIISKRSNITQKNYKKREKMLNNVPIEQLLILWGMQQFKMI